MASAGVPPDSAGILNPAPPHPVEIVTDSQPGAEDDDEDKILFPNRYGDIDERAVGTDDEMPEADNTTMQVNSHHADKYDNFSHENLNYEILLLLFHSVVLFLCRLRAQTEQLLTKQHDVLEAINRTPFNDRETARLFRAAQYSRIRRFELSGTNIGTFWNAFEQVALLLQYSRRYPGRPMLFFGLSSTGLDEIHYRRIIRAVLEMPRLPGPTGRPDVNETSSEMELQIQNASARTLYLPLHDATANIDLVVADEYCPRDPGRPPRCL
jgi:hypothetical protein